ncbi:MAG: hypothetical protein KatS3mg115_2235 [Candidatus Poribacteria bacterium]|nr:MAG: hypothetical protein KatS3mg115_2235 [Candidatus Poribacteria bacterium]
MPEGLVFIANLGNRDIALNVGDEDSPRWLAFGKDQEGEEVRKYLGLEQGGTRGIAAQLRRNPPRPERLRLPILEPALQLVLEQFGRIAQLVLIGTSNPPDERSHSLWDTIESAHLIKEHILFHRFRSDEIEAVEVIEYLGNPSSFEDAVSFFSEFLGARASAFGRAVASIRGGTPALNQALSTQLVALYGPKAALVETTEPPPEARVKGELGAARFVDTWPLRRNAILRALRALIQRHDYSGALKLLDDEEIETSTTEKIRALLGHGQARLNLDFSQAFEALEGLQGVPEIDSLRESAGEDYAWTSVRLRDIERSARVQWERSDWIGFVTRVAMFCETCCRQLVWHLTGFKPQGGQVFVQDLSRYLGRRGVKSLLEDLSLKDDANSIPITRKTLDALIQIGKIGESSERAKTAREITDFLQELKAVEELRHRALHDLRGINEAELRQRLPGGQLSGAGKSYQSVVDRILGRMETLEQTPDRLPRRDPYVRLRNLLLSEIDRL